MTGERAGSRGAAVFESVRVGALTLHRVTRAEVVDAVFAALGRGEGGSIVTANLDFVQRAAESAELAELYGSATIRVADGMPVLWLARLGGASFPERVAGSDLVWQIAERAARDGRSIFLLGGEPGAAERASQVLRERFPGLRIAGVAAPQVASPPQLQEIAALREQISAARPDLVYCAFGTPKQEQLMAALAPAVPRAWWLGCGASLSFIGGQRRRAPAWMQRLGLEWLHRAAQEPQRLGGRYLLRNLPFLVRAAVGQRRAERP